MREKLISQGFKVNVLSTQPSYKSVNNIKNIKWKITDYGGVIYRFPIIKIGSQKINKILNFFWFSFVIFSFLLFSKKYQIITVSTSPPIILAFCVAIVCKFKKAKLIYHCMDIHPEIGRLSGEFKNKWIFSFLERLDIFTCRFSSRIVVLSKDMKQSLINRDALLADKIETINNYNLVSNKFVDQHFFDPNDGKFRFVFAGNIGKFQKLDFIIKGMSKANIPKNVQLIFVGEGLAVNKLKSLVMSYKLGESIIFIPHQPLNIVAKIINDSNIAIVSLLDGVIRYAYPSKTLTYMSLGIPILALVEKDSELAKMLIKNNLGFVQSQKDLNGISNFFSNFNQHAFKFNENDIKKFFKKNYSRQIFESKFLSLIKDIL